MPRSPAVSKRPAAKSAAPSRKAPARKGGSTLQFLIHDAQDDVGVAVVDIAGGAQVSGLTLDTRKPVKAKALADVPLGHKIALRDFKVGDTVTKYGQDIGKVVKPIKKGDHVHVHNVKTKRW